jgi:DNA mismatch endonuclease (patch repair protein)
MVDMFTKEERSAIMSKIKSKGTKIELKMMRALEEHNIIFEYQPKMLGKPDFLVYPNLTIFCDSSFWHGNNWRALKKKLPKGYWLEHIGNNRERDKLVNDRLEKSGYIVLRFWDREIYKDIDGCIKKIERSLSA